MAPTESPRSTPSKNDAAAATGGTGSPAATESTPPADDASPLDVGTRLAVQASLRRTTRRR